MLMLPAVLRMAAQMPDVRRYQQLKDFPFVIVSEATVTTSPEISDSLFDAASQGIRFRVNRTELQPSDPFIRIYREQLVPWLRQNDMQLRRVFVRGAASPEGPYWNNVRLARERTRRLIDFLNTELGDSLDSDLHVEAESITEDYALLVKMMGEADDPDYERVDAIWQECEGDEACCKRQLMALDGGRLWRRLLREYFPSLRQARVVLWFARRHMPPAEPVSFECEVPPMPDVSDVRISMPEQEAPVRYERRHLVAARTNLVHDLLYVPQFGWAYGANIQLEYYPLRGHYTYNAGFTFINHRHWSDYKFFQIRDVQLELRRYFRGGGAFLGPYLALYGEATWYGIGFSKTKGWEGEGGGAGITAGYTCRLNRKGSLRLELSASLGAFVSRQDPYVYGNPLTSQEDGLYYYDYHGNSSDFSKRNHRFTWFGPTNAGIHLTYDIIYRKKKPAGYYQQRAANGRQKGGSL